MQSLLCSLPFVFRMALVDGFRRYRPTHLLWQRNSDLGFFDLSTFHLIISYYV